MQLRYTASALFLSLLLAFSGGLPGTGFAQDDEDLDLGSDDESDLDSGEEAAGEDEFADSEPTLDDEDDEELSDDEPLDDEDDFAPPPDNSSDFADEEIKVDHGPLAGRLQFAVTVGYGLRVAGDKTANLFRAGLPPEVNMLVPQEVGMAAVDPTAPTIAEQAQQIMNSYQLSSFKLEPKSNPFAMSFGARAGYSLPEDPVYIGASFSYFAGGSVTIPGLLLPASGGGPAEQKGTIKNTVSVLLMGGEVGLDWTVSDYLVIRPMLGVGAALASTKLCIAGGDAPVVIPGQPTLGTTPRLQEECVEESSTRLYYAPALAAIVPLDLFFLSAEGRFIGIGGAGGSVGFYLGASAGVALEL